MSKRVTGVWVDGGILEGIFADHLPAAALEAPAKWLVYGPPGQEASLWKRSCLWDDLWKSRHFVEDLATATGGKNIKQTCFRDGLEAHLRGKNIVWKEKEIVRATYRARLMLCHLREARRLDKSPPARLCRLQPLVDMMVLPHRTQASGDINEHNHDDDDDEALADDDSHDVLVTTVAPKVVPTIDVESSSSSDTDDSFDLFADTTTPTSSSGHAGHALAMQAMAWPCAISGHAGPRIDVEALVKQASTVNAIDPRIGNKNFGWGDVVLKRPAAAAAVMETPSRKSKKGATSTPKEKKSCARKLLYSKYYHQELDKQIKVVDRDTAKELARAAANKACHEQL